MTIVIDTIPLQSGHKARGVGRYTRQLATALKDLVGATSHRILLTSNVGMVDAPDLVHYPYFDLFHSHLPWFPQAPQEVVTIHDLTPLRLSTSFRPGIRSGFNLWVQKKLVKRIGAIITDSENSKRDIVEFLHIPKHRIFVIPLGVEKEFHPLELGIVERVKKQYELPKKYVLYVGDINVNKNIPTLINAMKNISLPLVIVSASLLKRSLPEVKHIEQAIAESGLGGRIIRLSNVPLDPGIDLAAIYCGALVYVQPSIYEGFGLPILEAMACGVPVVSSKAGSLPEVVGDAGLLVDPSVSGIENGIQHLLQHQRLRVDLRRKGLQRAHAMTWEKTARSTLRVYETVLQQGVLL